MATKKTTEVVENTTETTAETTEVVENKAPKKVKIILPITRTEKEDEYVALNGKSYLIKRGEEVEVPAGVAEILRNREKQLAKAFAFEAQASNSKQ